MRRAIVAMAAACAVALAWVPADASVTGADPSGDGTRAVDVRAVTFQARFATSKKAVWRVVEIRSWDRLRPRHIEWVRWQLDSTGGPAADYAVTATYEGGSWTCQADSLHGSASVGGTAYAASQRVGCRLPIAQIHKTKAVRFRAAAAGTDRDPDSVWVDLAPDSGWFGG